MNAYKYQAKATRAFGIEFRSKLEAQWAYRFTEDRIEWEYADCEWYDFAIDGCHIEIKPKGIDFALIAIKRAYPFRKKWIENKMIILCGPPDDFFTCMISEMTCGDCLRLSFCKPNETEKSFAWNPKSEVYGHWCEHGQFFRHENFSKINC